MEDIKKHLFTNEIFGVKGLNAEPPDKVISVCPYM